MTGRSKISVVTRSFNQSQFLERTILSVLNQNYPNLEYIIIDGGSTDGSVDIIKKYQSKLHYWISEPDNGMYDAINKGFTVSSGDIMTYINSDDILHFSSLVTVADLFERYTDICWLNGLPNQIDEKDRYVWLGSLPNWNRYLFLNRQYRYIQQEGCFWRRSIWERAGNFMDTKYILAADLDLWCRFFDFSSIIYVPTILGSFRVRSQNQKSLESINQYNKEAERVIDSFRKRAFNEELEKLEKYNSIPYKILHKIGYDKLFDLFGYSDIKSLFKPHERALKFDRKTQNFIY